MKKLREFKIDSKIDPLFRFPALNSFSNDEILEIFEIKTSHIGILTEKLSFTLEKQMKNLNEVNSKFQENQILALIKSLAQFTNFCHRSKFAIHNFSPNNIAIKNGNLVFINLSDFKFFNSEMEIIDSKSEFLEKCFPKFYDRTYNPIKADAYLIGLLILSLALNQNLFDHVLDKNDRQNYLNEIKEEMPNVYSIANYALNSIEDENKTVFEIFKKAEAVSSNKFDCPSNPNDTNEVKAPSLSEIDCLIESINFTCNVGKIENIKEEVKILLGKMTVLTEAEISNYCIPLLKFSQFLIHVGAFDTTANCLYLVEKCLKFKAKENEPRIELETELLAIKAAMKFEKKDFEDLEEYLKQAFSNINSNYENFRYAPYAVSYVFAGLCCYYKKKSNGSDFTYYNQQWDRILSNISCPTESLRKIKEINGSQLLLIGDFYQSQNEFISAKDSVESAFGTFHPDYVSLNLKISQALFEQDNDMEAFEYANKSFEAMLEEYGTMHRLSIPSLSMLGMIYFKKGQYTKAHNLYEKSAEIFRSVCGEKNPGYPSIINNIAIINSKLGNHQKALKFITMAKEIKESILFSYPVIQKFEFKISNKFIEITEGYDSEYLRIYNNFGLFKSNIGDKINAEILLMEAYSLSGELRKYNPDDFYIKKASYEILLNLAVLNEELGRMPLAKKYLETCDSEFSNMGINDKSSDRFKVRFNLAKLYTDERNFREAKAMYSRLEEDFCSKCTLDVASLYNNIGAMHYLCNEKDEAKNYFQKAYEIKMAIYKTEDREDVAASLSNLALVETDYDLALEKYLKSLQIMKIRYAEMSKKSQIIHHNIATIENNIGLILLKKRMFDRALEMLINSRDKKTHIFGSMHYEIGAVWNNIGICYYAKGDFAFAKESFAKALEIKRESLREGHPSMRDTFYNLMLILEKADLKLEAKKNLESHINKAKITYKKVNETEELGDFYFSIAEIYDLLKETPKAAKYFAEAQDMYSRSLGTSDEKTQAAAKMVSARREAI